MFQTRIRRRVLLFTLLTLGSLTSVPATTVSDFSLEDLLRHADAVVRVRVLDIGPRAGEHQSYLFEVEELLLGDVEAGPLRLELLHEIEGMPEFSAGDELLLFLNRANRVEKILGLRWGTYRIRDQRVFDHDGRALYWSPERRGERQEYFLRPRHDSPAGLDYTQLKSRIIDTDRQLRADAARARQSGPADLDRR